MWYVVVDGNVWDLCKDRDTCGIECSFLEDSRWCGLIELIFSHGLNKIIMIDINLILSQLHLKMSINIRFGSQNIVENIKYQYSA